MAVRMWDGLSSRLRCSQRATSFLALCGAAAFSCSRDDGSRVVLRDSVIIDRCLIRLSAVNARFASLQYDCVAPEADLTHLSNVKGSMPSYFSAELGECFPVGERDYCVTKLASEAYVELEARCRTSSPCLPANVVQP